MYVISRKKILYNLGIIILFVLVYAITSFNISSVNKSNVNSIATVALPVNKKVVVIDAGHGVPDERCSK